MTAHRPARILVIKLGALGDFVLAMGPFAAIRRHHATAHITLLTTPPYVGLGRACGYFDEVWVDPRAPLWRLRTWIDLLRRLRAARFDRVYDLQTQDRTNAYFHLLGRARPAWSGIARGCSHPHANPQRDTMHTVERQAEQLAMAGIPDVPSTDLSWATAELDGFGLAERFALVVPGGSAHRPEKRWPATRFAELARWLAGHGIQPVLVGSSAEREALAAIAAACPEARDLCGETTFEAVVELARRAAVAVGNDTGPMHLIAAAGCPSVVLYSNASDPARTAPRGAAVTVLQRASLGDLSTAAVTAAVRPR